MFKYLLVLALIGAVFADDDAHAHAKEYKKDDGHGHFEYGYDITNGIGADESGDEHQVHGEFHFVSKDGVPVKVSYTADENGFHPEGDILPTPPPTPEAILKALKYIEAHPSKDDGHVKHH
ncbi:larval cuticle protein 4-like [Teleopsis dalmanni]|uniref:larval cuticle protein 4-like n=1 Tax=Teleopsis dalmanni TaxID=139649 RepID=UPI0018CD72F9|nr:larval cuticle protein 4-like [Teleopsis dalmanni]